MTRKKKIRPSLWKLSIAIGVLLGASVKIWDYYKTRYIRCGVFNPPEQCTGLLEYLKEIPVWMILGIVVSFILIYGGKYLIIHGYHLIKDAEIPKAIKEYKGSKKESRKEKTEKKKETKEEGKKEEPEQEKKKIKI